jgi:DNA replication protein DnaC
MEIIHRCAPDNDYKSLCIFDDIGAQKLSDYVLERWYNIIDRRSSMKKPTLFTTNFSPKEIFATMGDRIASRICSGIVYELKGSDRRL